MKKNGFTLIELITVIALLSIIAVVLIPKINTAFKESYADQLEDVRINIKDATEIYIHSEMGKDTYQLLLNYESVRIYLNTLSNYGLIEDKIYNPMSNDYFDIDNEYVVVTMDEIGLISYEFSF